MGSLISVIIPCYGQAAYLHDCIGSLLAQDYFDWEAIIVNDGSPDDTEAVALGLCAKDRRVRYIRQDNGGLSAARNAGLKVAVGHYLQFLDADDILGKSKLRLHANFLDSNPDVDLVYGGAEYFLNGHFGDFQFSIFDEAADFNWIAARWADSSPLLVKLALNNMFPVCSPLVRAEAVRRTGSFRQDLRSVEDWDFWMRMVIAGSQFRYIDHGDGSAAYIRVHDKSMSQNRLRMASSEFAARLQWQPGLRRDGSAFVNRKRLLELASALPAESRGQRFLALVRVSALSRDTMMVLLAYALGSGSILAPAVEVGWRFVPSKLRAWLRAQGIAGAA